MIFEISILGQPPRRTFGNLPGVNAQEKTKAELVESLRVGAEDMLDTEVPFEPGAEMTTIDISDPVWAKLPFENLTVS